MIVSLISETRPQHLHAGVSRKGHPSQRLRDQNRSEAFQRLHAQVINIAHDGGLVLYRLTSDEHGTNVVSLSHDRKRAVPLKDNAFFIRVSGADYPATLVAYDNQGLVIGRSPTKPAFHGLG